MSPNHGSPPGKLDKDDAKTALGIALVMAVGAAVGSLAEYLTHQDFGVWTPAISALLGIITTGVARWVRDNSKRDET